MAVSHLGRTASLVFLLTTGEDRGQKPYKA